MGKRINYAVRLSNGQELVLRAVNLEFARMGIEQWSKENGLEYGPGHVTIETLYDMDAPTFIEGGTDAPVNLANMQ